jgi:hypothetical protein
VGDCATSEAGTAAADAPPTIEKVNPAAPNTGTDFITRFFVEVCFTRDIVETSIPFESSLTPAMRLYAAPMYHARQSHMAAGILVFAATHLVHLYEQAQRFLFSRYS